MDPLSLISGCISIVQGVELIYKFAKENVHSSASVKSQLLALVTRCSACKGLIEGIRIQAELNDGDDTRLKLLDHVKEPIIALNNAIKLIAEKLSKVSRHIVLGKVVNSSIANCLKTFDDTLRVLQLALQVDLMSVIRGNGATTPITTTASVREHVLNLEDDVQSLSSTTDQLRHDIAELTLLAVEERETEQTQRERRELRSWISSFGPSDLYHVLAEKAHPGTGSWFLENVFKAWLGKVSLKEEDNSRVLWLQGRSGSGKTTLITSVITHLARTERALASAFFFCSVSLADTRTLQNVVGGLLVQLCDQKPELWHAIKAWHNGQAAEQKGVLRKPQASEILEILRKVCGNFDDVLLILDAPNECESPKKVLAAIGELLRQLPCVRILISSTPDLDIDCLKHDKISRVAMSPGGVRTDIQTYVQARIEDDEQLSDFPQYLKDRILSKLLARADGSFRWAECQLSTIISDSTSEADVDRALDNLSDSIEDLYAGTLEAIPKTQTLLLRSALLWLVFAVRPLHIDELREAMIVRDNDSDELDSIDRLLPGKTELLLGKCRMLINYDAGSKHVSLAHSSVSEYLLSDSCREGTASQYYIEYDAGISLLTRLSIGYLNRKALSDGFTTSIADVRNRTKDLPLLQYVGDSWPVYAQLVSWNENSDLLQTQKVIQKFFDSFSGVRGGNFGAWIQVHDPRHLYFLSQVKDQALSSPLYYSARRGWVEIASLIIKVYGKDHLESLGGSRASTPLHVAAAYGRTSMVELLLRHGANPKERNKYGERGIAWAEYYGYDDIVQMYIDYGATPPTEWDMEAVEKPWTSMQSPENPMPA